MMCVYCIQCIVYCTYTAVNILYTGTVNYHRFAFNVLGVLIIKVHCTQCTVHIQTFLYVYIVLMVLYTYDDLFSVFKVIVLYIIYLSDVQCAKNCTM